MFFGGISSIMIANKKENDQTATQREGGTQNERQRELSTYYFTFRPQYAFLVPMLPILF